MILQGFFFFFGGGGGGGGLRRWIMGFEKRIRYFTPPCCSPSSWGASFLFSFLHFKIAHEYKNLFFAFKREAVQFLTA